MRTAAAALLTLTLAAGCGSGGTLTASSLEQQATTVHGLAGEGNVMATAASHGDLTGPYRRVHAAELGDAAASAATALAAPVASDALAPVARRLRAEALAVERAFRVLAAPSISPAEATAARAAFTRSATVTAGGGGAG